MHDISCQPVLGFRILQGVAEMPIGKHDVEDPKMVKTRMAEAAICVRVGWPKILLVRSSRSSFSAHCKLSTRRKFREFRHFIVFFELEIQMRKTCSSLAAVEIRCLYSGLPENYQFGAWGEIGSHRGRPGPWSLCRFIALVENRGFFGFLRTGLIGPCAQIEPLKMHRHSCR